MDFTRQPGPEGQFVEELDSAIQSALVVDDLSYILVFRGLIVGFSLKNI